MIIISCPGCNKPIERNHAYKLQDGAAWHVDCEAPGPSMRTGKTIRLSTTKEDGSRTPGSGEGK